MFGPTTEATTPSTSTTTITPTTSVASSTTPTSIPDENIDHANEISDIAPLIQMFMHHLVDDEKSKTTQESQQSYPLAFPKRPRPPYVNPEVTSTTTQLPPVDDTLVARIQLCLQSQKYCTTNFIFPSLTTRRPRTIKGFENSTSINDVTTPKPFTSSDPSQDNMLEEKVRLCLSSNVC